MGVTGSGKSTTGSQLAAHLGWAFVDADDLHPAANVTKMAAGTPLDDDDRAPWLAAVRDSMSAAADAGSSSVMACSALRRAYRDVLAGARGRVRLVHLDVDGEEITERVSNRPGHFMPATLVQSQFATLERLAPDEDGVVVPVTGGPDVVLATALASLGL